MPTSAMLYFVQSTVLVHSVADPDPGSGAFLTPGFGIRNGFFPDPGSIPDLGSHDHILKSFLTIFSVKSSIILGKLAQIFFLALQN